MKNTFEDLLKRYADGSATAEEREEFFRLLNAGDHDQTVEAQMSEDLKAMIETPPYPDKQLEDSKKKVYKRLKPYIEASLRKEGGSSPSIRTWLMAATTVGILVLGVGYWFSTQEWNSGQEVTQQEATGKSFTGPDSIRLADGSTLWLNAGSRLRLQETFGENTREVFLTGEAFFDVAHDASAPFIVHTGKVTTTVLGTAFNVKAFPGEEIKVTVARGLVQVADEKRIFGKIKPEEQITIKAETDEFRASRVNVTTETMWREALLVLKAITIRDAAKRIGEKFNVTVIISNEELFDCKISTSFSKNDGLEQVLNVLTGMTKAEYKVDGSTVYIEGGTCH